MYCPIARESTRVNWQRNVLLTTTNPAWCWCRCGVAFSAHAEWCGCGYYLRVTVIPAHRMANWICVQMEVVMGFIVGGTWFVVGACRWWRSVLDSWWLLVGAAAAASMFVVLQVGSATTGRVCWIKSWRAWSNQTFTQTISPFFKLCKAGIWWLAFVNRNQALVVGLVLSYCPSQETSQVTSPTCI